MTIMNKQKSFTLIELLVVIVIIGILAGVIMISTSSSIDKANITKSKVFEGSVENNLAANMVSRWKLDQINYPAANQTPDAWASNTGTLYGANGLPQLRPSSECVSDGCLLFDGGDDFVDFGGNNNLDIRGDVSISLWIKPNLLSGNRIIFRSGYSMSPYNVYQADKNIYFYYTIGSTWGGISISNTLTSLEWYHLVAVRTFSSGNIGLSKVFINGQEKGSVTRTGTPDIGNSNTTIGYDNSSQYYFNGYIDDVRIYNAALSSSQIKQNYIAGLDFLLSKGNIPKEDYNQKISELAYE